MVKSPFGAKSIFVETPRLDIDNNISIPRTGGGWSMFEFAWASLIGECHRGKGCGSEKNQDGLAVIQDDDVLIIVVADGNSSAANSEVGAGLLSKVLANIVRRHTYKTRVTWDTVWRTFVNKMDHLRRVAELSAHDAAHVYFPAAFTVFVTTPLFSQAVCFGDGWVSVNRNRPRGISWWPNAPPCVAHLLLPSEERTQYKKDGQKVDPFPITLIDVTSDVVIQEVAVGSDGAEDLLKSSFLRSVDQDRIFKGETDKNRSVALAGAIRQFMEASDLPVVDDDLTIVIARRIR